MTPIKAIRLFCLECCGGSSNEVKLCPSTTCSLYPFRLGKTRTSSRVRSQKNSARLLLSGWRKGRSGRILKNQATETNDWRDYDESKTLSCMRWISAICALCNSGEHQEPGRNIHTFQAIGMLSMRRNCSKSCSYV